MPSTLNTMCIRAAPFPSIFLGYCGVLFDIYFTLQKGSGHIHQTQCVNFQKGQFWLIWHWLTRKRTPFACRGDHLQTVPKIQMVLVPLGPPPSFYILKHQGQPLVTWPSTSRLKILFLNWSFHCKCCEKVAAEFVNCPWEISLAKFC